MIAIGKSKDRGHFDHGWLDTYHSFSFGEYHDPARMGFRSLRVINEDRVAPGQGFGMHPHRDMEIITYVLEGALEHRDSMGHREILRPGEVQHMTAGTGIRHSEFNPSDREPVHLVQIWLLPERTGLTPSYQQKPIASMGSNGPATLIGSHDGRNGSLTIRQDADLYVIKLKNGGSVRHELVPGRHAWLQALRGSIIVNGAPLEAGDAAALSDEPHIEIRSDQGGEALLFDLA